MNVANPRLSGHIGPFQLFALGFGSIIGSAWVVILNQWLAEAGPGGSILAFVAGGIVFLAVGFCYAELTARVPRVGGDFVFALEAFGPRIAYMVGWFIALGWITITIFEGIAVSWVIQLLLPGLPDLVLYSAFGTPVTAVQIVSGMIGALMIATVNYRGGDGAARLQGVLTYGFLAFVLAMLFAMLLFGNAGHMRPLTAPGDWRAGALSIFASCAFLLNGFQTIAQAVEERAPGVSLRTVARVMVVSIAAAAAFYCLAITAASMMAPWQQLAGTDLAMLAAAQALPGGTIVGPALLLALLASLLKTWNGVFLTSSRILLSLSREGLLPAGLGRLHARHGSPWLIVLVIAAINLTGLFLGRGAIGFLVDTCATAILFSLVVSCAALAVLRRPRQEAPAFAAPGGPWVLAIALAGLLAMTATALVQPYLRDGLFAGEYILLLAWALLGLALLVTRAGGSR